MNLTQTTPLEAGEAPSPEAFVIDTQDKLEWFGRKLAAKEQAVIDLDEQYKHVRKALVGELEDFRDHFAPQVEAFVRDHLPSDSKTLKTLAGDFAVRTVPGGLRTVDKDRVAVWAKGNAPELVRASLKVQCGSKEAVLFTTMASGLGLDLTADESVPAAALKDHWQTTGEIPDGCLVSDPREALSLKVAGRVKAIKVVGGAADE